MTEFTQLRDLFGVAGKVVAVTGGSRGIGRSIAEGFVKAGARVYVCGRQAEACELTARELSEDGECCGIPAHLGTVEGCQSFADELATRETRLDVLINNAGTLWAEPLSTYPEVGWDKVFDINVKAPFYLIQSLLPMLEAAASAEDPARIITIGSIDAFHVPKHETYAYSASKAAVHQLARHLAKLLAPSNITSNVVAPGMFPSEMTWSTIEANSEGALLERVPLKRFVSSSDMAGATIFLASRAGAGITGAVLPVDGGTATTL
jgi:NAD(P)-dependent dehydrogenase (short-subunit alcohol dehydrogenase family)